MAFSALVKHLSAATADCGNVTFDILYIVKSFLGHVAKL
jgi:hypothetical protein